jgi:hypothetical protein
MNLLALDDPESLALLRALLASAQYNEGHIQRTLKAESIDALRTTDIQLMNRSLPKEGLLPALLRLFLCLQPADPAELAKLIKPLTPEKLQSLGIARLGPAGLEPRVRLAPIGDLVLASEYFPGDYADLPRDFVIGLNPTSVALANITIRKPFKAALDVGSGNGIQSILASRHCGRVVATDLNPRAVNFTAFNCLLNGITNVECRAGSLFEPVAGETFDLIVCNPPFVVSPDANLTFRDSGRPLDTFCRDLVAEIPRHLKEGGFAELLCSWVLRTGEAWPTPPTSWVEGSGCNALIFHTTTETPLAYASSWNRQLRQTHPEKFGAALDRWTTHFKQADVAGIASGGIVLQKRSGGTGWVLPMDVPTDRDASAGEHVRRMFESREWMNRPATEEDVLQSAFRPSEGLRFDQAMGVVDGRLAPVGMWAGLVNGFKFRGDVDAFAARLLILCDGKLRVGEIVEGVRGEFDATPDEIRAKAVSTIREFYEAGLLLRS